MAIPLITVTGQFLKPDATPADGQVDFKLSYPLTDTSTAEIYERVTTSAALDSTGSMSVQLVATDHADASPAGVVYEISQRIHGAATHVWYAAIEGTPLTVDLTELTPAESPTGIVAAAKVFIQPEAPPARYVECLWIKTVGPDANDIALVVRTEDF